MKKLILVFLIVLAAAIIYLIFQFRGALPTILPPSAPKETPKLGQNNLGLNLPDGFAIDIFAKDLKSPRVLALDSVGTLLTSITAEGKVVALPDKDHNGKADAVVTVLEGLERPHGLAFYDGKLFIAQETKVVRYQWDSQKLAASFDKILFNLPKGGRHFTRTIAFDNSGRMFIAVGSTCDVCFEKGPLLAAVLVSDSEGNNLRVWAKGLRNSVFITINPDTGELWGTEMGRDFLGDNLPPDEINIIGEGKDYGWPLCYGNRVHDTDFDERVYIQIVPQPPCGETEPPIYEICAHCAPLGLTFINSARFLKEWQSDLLVAYHGSWNRSTPTGYKVVRLKIEDSKIIGEEDFITGFLEGTQVRGRPVDLIFDSGGNLYLSDDKAGVVYKVSRS